MYSLGDVRPSLDDNRNEFKKSVNAKKNLAPICREIAADLETPVSAFIKLTQGNNDLAFLLESVEGGENLARFSLIGSRPFKTLKTGPEEKLKGDPLIHLENEMKNYDCIEFPNLKLPPFIGGAVGYVGYDCVRYFEPSTEKFVGAQKAKMKIPESMFMLCDTIVVFDHVRHSLKIVSHVRLDTDDLKSAYESATKRLDFVVSRLSSPILSYGTSSSRKRKSHDENLDIKSMSNVGQSGYESFVKSLKTNITNGDIIQAVPSQRIAIPMQNANDENEAFNLYRRLRTWCSSARTSLSLFTYS